MASRFYLLLTIIFIHINCVNAQDVQRSICQAKVLIGDGDYKKAYNIIQSIDEEQASVFGDSCVMMLNYEKGTCLYYLDKYEESIPYLKKALLKIEKMPHEDCNYLEIIYGIGSCYNHLEQYENAEKYFRRVIIRNNVEGYVCTIKTQTLRDLTELYKKQGYTKLAKACAEKISWESDNLSGDNWTTRIKMLSDLAESYENQGKLDEEIKTYRNILNVIESNASKEHDEYLLYAGILRMKLLLYKRYSEAIPVLEDIIFIGKSLKSNKKAICDAYVDYLEIMSMNNHIEIIQNILPEAIQYMKNTKDYNWRDKNLYEIVGNGYFLAENYEEGVKWLEKPWYGHIANSILSLTNLGNYYFESNPNKALFYFKESEKQIANASNDETRSFIYENLMHLYSNLGKYDESIKYAELAAPYIKDIKDNDYFARHLIFWAINCQQANMFQKTELIFHELESMMQILSAETKALVYSNLGYVYICVKKIKDCIDILTMGIEFVKRELGDNSQILTTMYHNLGRAYMLQNNYKNALTNLYKSKDLQIKLNGNAMQRTLDYINECEAK